jgi:phage protein D
MPEFKTIPLDKILVPERLRLVEDDHPFPAGPAAGTRYSAAIGWSESGARHAGIYTVQSSAIGGDAVQGYTMTVTCRAADYLDKMKEVDSEHFDEMTVGEIFQQLAGRAGVSAVVDPELACAGTSHRSTSLMTLRPRSAAR